MGDELGSAPLSGSWSHSFEEDDDGIEVYRPTLDYAFPPSRQGRRRLSFGPDEVVESVPGPTDRPEPRAAFQPLDPRTYRGLDAAEPGFKILEATPDVLKIRRG